MAIPPDPRLIDLTGEQWTINEHFLSVHAAIMNQIAKITHGTMVLDQVLHSITVQLRDALQVSGCLIVQSDQNQELASSDARLLNPQENSLALALALALVKQGAEQGFSVNVPGHCQVGEASVQAIPLTLARQSLVQNSLDESSTVNVVTSSSSKVKLIASNVPNPKCEKPIRPTQSVSLAVTQQESLGGVYRDFHTRYYSLLAQGKPLILPVIQGELPGKLQDSARECGLSALLIVPMLYQQSYIGSLTLYQQAKEREWTSQEIAFVQAIASHCAIALTLAKLEQRCQAEITNRQKVEEQLKQSVSAEEDIHKALVRAKEVLELQSQFIFMTSHEFRTPLTTIQSSAELLEYSSQKWAEEKKLNHLHRIQTAVKHMTQLLNDVLIIGKAEAGKQQLNLAPLDLENFCRNLVEELQCNDTYQHQITFTTQGIDEQRSREERGESREVDYSSMRTFYYPLSPKGSLSSPPPKKLPYLDEKLLRQILENLLGNAIKYSPISSTINFTFRYLDDQVIFRICDRGIGISLEDQQRLFETFHRASNVGTIAGTGLGLAIVKKCVEIHQGQIAVESEVGVGTTFTVTLPMYNSLVP